MPLTRNYKETIRERAQRDPKFRKQLLREGLEAMLSGKIRLAKTILRDYTNDTAGFTGLAKATHIPPKSLLRMFSPSGNRARPTYSKLRVSCSSAKACAFT